MVSNDIIDLRPLPPPPPPLPSPLCLYRRGPRAREVGEEGVNTYRLYTVATRMTPALRWAAMGAVHSVTATESDVHKPQPLKR